MNYIQENSKTHVVLSRGTNGMRNMVKYGLMRFLVIALAFLTSSAYAAKNVLPRPGDEGYADGEASTNEVFAVGAICENWLRLTLEMGASTNNTVAIEFGKDGNSDGKLSCEEIDLSLGWMGGKMFLKDCRTNLAVTRDLGSGHHKLIWLIRLIPDRVGWRVVMMDDRSEVLKQVFPNALIDESWNLVRIVRRGVSSSDERVSYSGFNFPFRVIVR